MKLAVWRVEWGNAYTPPRDGRPRVLAEMVVSWDDGGDKAVPPALRDVAGAPGNGWAIVWRFLPPPQRITPPETLAPRRRKALARRMEKNYPLFAEQFTQEKIAAVPGYYVDGKGDYDEERQVILAAEAAYYEEARGRVGVLVRFEEPAMEIVGSTTESSDW